MTKYNADQIREIAVETGDNEIIARFESYIAAGYALKSIPRVTGKFKPMLAMKANLKQIKKFPIIASPKHDGIRGILHPEFGLISRSSKSIPNDHVRSILESFNIWSLDGEIVTFTNGKQDSFNTIQSKIMMEEGTPDFKFIIFDDFENPQFPYLDRLENARTKIKNNEYISITNYSEINDMASLVIYEGICATISEGLITRAPLVGYKNGKSTIKEGGCLKIKRFMDDEGVIVEVTKITNGLNLLGSLTVMWKKKRFNLGNGWTDEMAADMWRNRHDLIGKKVTFSYQGIGANGAPRFSSFIGIRRDI